MKTNYQLFFKNSSKIKLLVLKNFRQGVHNKLIFILFLLKLFL